MAYNPSADEIDDLENITNSNQAAPSIQNQPQNTAPTSQGLLGTIANSAPLNFTLGAGDAVRNLLSLGYLDKYPSGSGTAYNLGNIAGNVGSFLGGGEVLKGLGLVPRAIQSVADLSAGIPQTSLMQSISSALSSPASMRALGSGLFGAAEDPNNRLKGFGEGIGLSKLADAVPATINAFRPNKYSDQVLQDITDVYKNGQQKFKNVMNEVGDQPIYNTAQDSAQSYYHNLPTDVLDSYGKSLSKVHQNFLDNPTFQNAHDLQSQLGTLIGKLQNKNLTQPLVRSERDELSDLSDARDALQGDISKYLAHTNPQLGMDYADASQNWKNVIAPLMSKGVISKAVKTNIANPGAQISIPPAQLLKTLQSLPKDIPGLNNYIGSLNNRIGLQNLAQRGTGAALGASLFPHAEEVATLAGTMMGPTLARALGRFVPNSAAISQTAKNILPYGRDALISNILANNGGQQ